MPCFHQTIIIYFELISITTTPWFLCDGTTVLFKDPCSLKTKTKLCNCLNKVVKMGDIGLSEIDEEFRSLVHRYVEKLRKGEKMPSIQAIFVPSELYDRIEEEAKKRDKSVSEMAKTLLEGGLLMVENRDWLLGLLKLLDRYEQFLKREGRLGS